ncbi:MULTISPECIES: hypothetical protein [Serratia]|uniref:Uncharacterized protein n=1 Tax=Serratia fonticola TaxID=47917 RepID=A0AAW3WVK7_SERFO|nr:MULTISPECIES: hypothetical protein [Serratia]MBC3214765.1 hypothetical protein [Serratia fonticola]NYA15842.1 hypothetical protein [Serratia fonticola]NYA35686.1 hypothetical protein [Serratia fonticola]OCJ32634.1 hypothetical protein A6U95_26905 [Serratia sp. 14-2641]
MGRSVKVEISGREFPSKKAAVDYFMDQREAVKGSGPIREGHLFEDLRELYTRYCELTKWELGNREIYAFSVDYDPRHTDQNYGSYLCYWVQFSPKDRLSFSVREAVDEIAKTAAEQP